MQKKNIATKIQASYKKLIELHTPAPAPQIRSKVSESPYERRRATAEMPKWIGLENLHKHYPHQSIKPTTVIMTTDSRRKLLNAKLKLVHTALSKLVGQGGSITGGDIIEYSLYSLAEFRYKLAIVGLWLKLDDR